jgi:hypothetical protein
MLAEAGNYGETSAACQSTRKADQGPELGLTTVYGFRGF